MKMTEKNDLTRGKSWFQIMWQNRYIQIFAIGLLLLIYIIVKAQEIIDYSGIRWLFIVAAIPVMMMVMRIPVIKSRPRP